MDKEAQNRVAGIIDCNVKGYQPLASGDGIAEWILKALERLGYRKLPEGKPPLSKGNPYDYSDHRFGTEAIAYDRGKQAQRDSDIKWMK